MIEPPPDTLARALDPPERAKPRAKPARIAQLLAGLVLLELGLGSGDPAHAQPADVRTVTMRLAPDETYRAQPNWEAALRNTVGIVSDIYEKKFQVRFVIIDIVPWTAGPSVDPERLLDKMGSTVPIGEADVLIGFSNRRCERLKYGWASAFHRYAMVMTGCYETLVLKDTAPEHQCLPQHQRAERRRGGQ